MDTLQPLEEIDLSFPAQPSSSSTFITSHNDVNVMAIPAHIPADSSKEIETEPQDEARQQFVGVVIPAKRPSSDDIDTMSAVKAEPVVVPKLKEEEQQRQEEDEYMGSENEEDTGLASSRPGYRFPSSTNSIAKPYNARGDELFFFFSFCQSINPSVHQSFIQFLLMYN